LVNNWWFNGGKQPQGNSWGFFFSFIPHINIESNETKD